MSMTAQVCWPDGERAWVDLRVAWGKPSFLPDSVGGTVEFTWEKNSFGGNLRILTLKRPDHSDLRISWEVLSSSPPIPLANAKSVVVWSTYPYPDYNADAEEGELRLVRPPGTGEENVVGGLEGSLEIHHDGEWGRICDSGFEDKEARVACHQLGLSGGTALSGAPFGEPVDEDVKLMLDEVNCTVYDTKLTDCAHNGWENASCTHAQTTALKCSPGPPVDPPDEGAGGIQGEGNLRLVNTDDPDNCDVLTGAVEIFHNGEWGRVCDDFWWYPDAQVACRQLGYTGGTPINRYGRPDNYPDVPFWMDDVKCDGDELKLADCRTPGWGVHNCTVDPAEDAAVTCEAAEE